MTTEWSMKYFVGKLSNVRPIGLPILLIALMLAPFDANRTRAADQTNEFPADFGMVGLAAGQALRVNVVNIGDPNVSALACGIIINDFDASGNPLGSDVRASLLPGQATFVDLSRSAITTSRLNRIEIRPVVRFADSRIPPGPCAQMRLTVEVYDALTGRTQVFIGDPSIAPEPHL